MFNSDCLHLGLCCCAVTIKTSHVSVSVVQDLFMASAVAIWRLIEPVLFSLFCLSLTNIVNSHVGKLEIEHPHPVLV